MLLEVAGGLDGLGQGLDLMMWFHQARREVLTALPAGPAAAEDGRVR